ncbi:2'-5'-oligoadenylate synthase 1-like [Branchiostoma lanceolatum]|uniref:2'-5'-oligoadenylate synthase 1-like n=1 Tax=Branchiostoma lanceolatum TaxID=7740 RepID=UPI003456BAA3
MESCNICSKSFGRKSSRLQHTEDKHHIYSHASLTCDIGACGRSFGKESSLWYHKEMSQHGEKRPKQRKTKNRGPYKCVICSNGFSTPNGMQQHRKDKHGSSASRFGGYSFTAHATTRDPSSDSESDDNTDSDSSSDYGNVLDISDPANAIKYISDHLQTDKPFRDECSSVVEHLANFLKRSSGFKVEKIIKGGSLGKGTAIKSKSDIDLVMFISELPSIDSPDYNDELHEQLDELQSTLKSSMQSIAYDLKVTGRTGHAVKLRVQAKADHEPHEVDLLLANDMLGPSPTKAKKERVYAMMGRLDARARDNCSAALVELQRDFVKKQPAEVKDLIRLVKMWKKSCVPETSLKSYIIELLCIHVCPSRSRVAEAFKAVLEKLCDIKSVSAYWLDNYSYSRVVEMLGKRPLILDPSNPYNNVADSCWDWDEVAKAARETLQKPFLRYI